jgi:hypothetical protein
MSLAQATFAIVTTATAAAIGILTYPAVRRRASTTRDTLLAVIAAATLCATPIGLAAGALAHLLSAPHP